MVTIGGRLYCAACKNEHLRDLSSGVSSALKLAGIGRRFVAVLIDGMIIGAPVFLIVMFATMYTAMTGSDAATPSWATWLGYSMVPVRLVYEALMLRHRGQTLGKMMMAVRVVRPDGSPISPGQAWGRATVHNMMVSLLVIFDYLPAFFTKEKTCLHDLAAGTRVISVD